jgi:cilia- and flagella-associated protein 43
VSPEEIMAEKYVSPADRKRLQEEEQAAEARARRAQMDNAFDRALKQMMGGSLQGKVTRGTCTDA